MTQRQIQPNEVTYQDALVRRIDALERKLGQTYPPLVTTLPTSPLDGDQIDLIVDDAGSVSGPHIWRCRYREATTGTSKWHVIGGSAPFALYYGALGTTTTTSTTVVDFITGTAGITLPFTGNYLMRVHCASILTTATIRSYFISAYNAAKSVGLDYNHGAVTDRVGSAGEYKQVINEYPATARPAGEVWRPTIFTGAAGDSFSFLGLAHLIFPLRLGP